MKLLEVALVVAVATAGNAPADQYFGKLKMSALRIRYETVSVRDRYETHKILPEDAQHLAFLTEDSFDDWLRNYPHDGWLASTGYLLARVYEELPGKTAQTRAIRLLTYVKTTFPTTRYATLSGSDLHRGVPVRSDPAWAAAARAARAATATPSAQPSVSATPSASPSPSPAR